MKISTTTHVADQKCGEGSMRLLAQAGFHYADYSPTMSQYHAFAGLYTLADDEFKSFFERDRKRSDEAGIQIGQIHAPFNSPPDRVTEEELAFFITAVKRAIWACHLLNSPCAVIHPIIFPDWQENPAHTFEINNRLFVEYAALAERYQVKLAVENMPGRGVPYCDSKDLLELLRTVNSPCMAVCLDTGHAHLSMPAGRTVADVVRDLGKHLQALHVHDNDASGDQHRCPYLGTIDWPAFMRALAEIGYTHTLNLEAKFSEHMPADLQLPAHRFLYEPAVSLCDPL